MKTRTGYLVKRGKTFYAVWTIAGHKFTKTTGKHDRREALTELARIMQPFLVEDEVKTLETVKARIEGAKSELAAFEEVKNPPLTIRQAWNVYLKAANRPDTGKTTLEKHEGKMVRFVAWMEKNYPGNTPMRDVTDEHAEAYTEDLAKTGMAPATFNAHIGLLRLVWRILAKKAKTDRNPWTEIQRKRVAAIGRRELTVDELRTICDAAKGELRTLFALGIYTGLRLGDCATLRWAEVDLVRGIITRIPGKTARRNPKPVQMPIHSSLRTVLEDIPAARRGEYVLPETAALYFKDGSAVCKLIQQHFEANGIRTARPGTGFVTVKGDDGKEKSVSTGKRAAVEVGFHSLRHSFVSLCRAANVPLSVVESLVSHASPAMTRHYSHTGQLAAAAAVNSLPVVIGDAPALLPPTDPLAAFKGKVRFVADKLNGKNWRAVREELHMIAAG